MCTRAIVNIGVAWSLQRGKTEGTKSIVSKVIYGRGGVYQFASGRCERAWNARALSSPVLARDHPTATTSRTSTSRHSRTNDHYLRSLSLSHSLTHTHTLLLRLSLHPAISVSLHLSRPHLIIFRLNREGKRQRERERERERRGTRQALGYLPLKLPSVGARSAKRPAVRQANSKVD